MFAARKLVAGIHPLLFSCGLAYGDVTADAKVIKISGGEPHTLVLTAGGWAWGCGDNYYSQLGIGTALYQDDQEILVRVHGPNDVGKLGDINDVDAGWKHSLAVDVDGLVWSWGTNVYGQLGDGSVYLRHTPVRVLSGAQDPEDANSVLQYVTCISAGRSGEHSLAVDANGYAYAWGRNTAGQCGNGESSNSELTPVCVLAGQQNPSDPNAPLQQIIAVSAGENHSMGLEAYDPNEDDPNLQGRVYTWGDDTFYPEGEERGVLGNGATGPSSAVRPVCVWAGEQDYDEPNHVYLKDIVAISAGWDHSMVLEKWDDPCDTGGADPNHKGRVYTWGNNAATKHSNGGRLGDGSTDSNSTPVVVLSGEQYGDDPNHLYLEHIIAISAGEGHSMALDVNNNVYCWGDNPQKTGFLQRFVWTWRRRMRYNT